MSNVIKRLKMLLLLLGKTKYKYFITIIIYSLALAIGIQYYVTYGNKLILKSIGTTDLDLFKQGSLITCLSICISSLIYCICSYINLNVVSLIVENLRIKTFDILLELPMKFYENLKSSSIVYTNRFKNLELLFTNIIPVFFVKIVPGIFALLILFFTNWTITLFLLIISTIILLIDVRFTKVLEKLNKSAVRASDEIREMFQSTVLGAIYVKLFSFGEYLLDEFNKKNIEQENYLIKRAVVSSIIKSLNDTISSIGFILIIILSIWILHIDLIKSGVIIQFLLLYRFIVDGVSGVSSFLIDVTKAAPHIDDTFSIFISYEEYKKSKSYLKKESVPGANGEFAIFASKVSLQRANSQILNNINLEIKKNKVIAIAGTNGSGKSSLLKLFSGLYDDFEGDLLINNKPINSLSWKEISETIVFIPQDTYLFNTTIAENISLGNPDITHDEVIEVAKKSFAHDFIMSLPMKYEAQVGEEGGNLSEGQKQLILISRAMLKKGEILLFDEATSNLDPRMEKSIFSAMENLFRSKTSIIVARNMRTFEQSDQVIVLDHGTIIERGKHHNLLKENTFYKKLKKDLVKIMQSRNFERISTCLTGCIKLIESEICNDIIVKDISIKGFRIQSPAEIEIGELVIIQFKLHNLCNLNCIGRITRKFDLFIEYEYGIKIEEISDFDEYMLRDYIFLNFNKEQRNESRYSITQNATLSTGSITTEALIKDIGEKNNTLKSLGITAKYSFEKYELLKLSTKLSSDESSLRKESNVEFYIQIVRKKFLDCGDFFYGTVVVNINQKDELLIERFIEMVKLKYGI